MYRVNYWIHIDGNEFYDYLDFESTPSMEDIGQSIFNKHNTLSAYVALHGDNITQNQSTTEFVEQFPYFPEVFLGKLRDHLG